MRGIRDAFNHRARCMPFRPTCSDHGVNDIPTLGSGCQSTGCHLTPSQETLRLSHAQRAPFEAASFKQGSTNWVVAFASRLRFSWLQQTHSAAVSPWAHAFVLRRGLCGTLLMWSFFSCQPLSAARHTYAYACLAWLKDASCCRAALTTRQVVVGFQGLFAGVAHMHRQGLVDQDLHAGNILLSPDRSALIKADLGNAVPKEVEGCPNWQGRIM